MTREPPILLLEHARVVSLDRLAGAVVAAVAIHRVDEEQAEHLDPLRAQALLLGEVLADGAADHLPRHHAGVHVAPRFAPAQVALAAGDSKFDQFLSWPDANLPDAATAVEDAARGLFEIITVLHGLLLAPDPPRSLDVQFDARADRPAAVAGRHQTDVGPVMGVLHGCRGHLDLLHELALVGVDRVEPVDHVMPVGVGRRVTQRTQGIHGGQRRSAPPLQPAVHALRLVDDQDGARGADQIDRLLAAGLLALLVEVVDVLLVDGARGHHHDPYLRADGEAPHLAEARGVVEKVLERRARIECAEVVLGDPQRLVDALLDRHRRHHDDELGEPVALVQFQDGAQVDVGLAGTGLHLHGKLAGLQGRGLRQAIAKLDRPEVGEEVVIVQGQPVAYSEVRFGIVKLRVTPRDGKIGTAYLLPAEQITNCSDRLKLKVEIMLEV